MAQPHHDPAFCNALGQQWIDAWNSRDLERVLALYADDSEMTSDKIPLLGFDASGNLQGKDKIRAWLDRHVIANVAPRNAQQAC